MDHSPREFNGRHTSKSMKKHQQDGIYRTSRKNLQEGELCQIQDDF